MKLALLFSALVSVPLLAQNVQMHAPMTAVKQQGQIRVANASLMQKEATVVRQLAGGKNGKAELVKSADGRYSKRLTTNGNRVRVARHQAAEQLAEDKSLYEDFSGWDGYTDNWIPEDWSETNSKDTIVMAYPQTYTWHVESNDLGFLATPEHGDYLCSIYLGTSTDTAGVTVYADADEWLISPEFTPKEKEVLKYSLSFSPFWMLNTDFLDWDTFEFTARQRTASVQTYLQVDGGDWKLLYDPFDDWKDASMDVLMDDGLSNDWRTYKFSMSEYVGHKVRVAFRYQGKNGENWAIDYAGCAALQPEACYMRPGGAYMYGYSDDYNSLTVDTATLMLVPANTEVTWTNTSNDDAESFYWIYDNQMGDSAELGTSQDIDLTISFQADPAKEFNWYYLPELVAMAEGADSSAYEAPFYCLQAGGYAHYTFKDATDETLFGVGNYDMNNKFTSFYYDDETPLYGVSAHVDSAWSDLFEDTVALAAVGNYFDAPETPYQLHQISVLCGADVELPANAEISMTLVRVSYGYLADTIAQSVCTGETAHLSFTNNGENYYALPFTFTDTVDGFESEVDLEISDAFIAFLDVKGAKNIENLALFQSYYPDKQEETNGYFYILTKTGKRKLYPISVLSSSLGACYNSFLFNLYLTYPIEDTSVKTVSKGTFGTEGRYYNLQGQLMNDAKGICIMKDGKGNVKKMWK